MGKVKEEGSSRTANEDSDSDEWVKAGDLFSDESSFYGDADTKLELERRVAEYDPKEYWDVVQWNIQCLAARASRHIPQGTKRKLQDDSETASTKKTDIESSFNRSFEQGSATKLSSKSEQPYNPWEGDQSGKQLSESLDDFLLRLPPSSTTTAAVGPWIWVANPYSSRRPTDENMGGFKQEASKALAEYSAQKLQCERENPDKAPASITRMLKAEREFLEEQLIDLAKRFGVVCGKWMLFPSSDDVDTVWRIVARAVINDELGCSAKVATDDGDPDSKRRLVSIYTTDFSDIADVRRVLNRMRELGFTRNAQGNAVTVYYKCDAYTHLDLSNGNEYKLKTSMYNSKDMLSEKST